MAAQEPTKQICPGCGEKVAADLRYCVYCYRPMAGAKPSRAHVDMASRIATTHRDDPTVIFLPEEHEAIKRRARRRKRLIITAAISFVIIIAGAVTWQILNRQWREKERALARETAARRELKLLADALERFRIDVGRYPTNEEGILSLARKPAAIKSGDGALGSHWAGPYLEHVPEVDPWGNDYIYQTADRGESFELFSAGPGGEIGSQSQFRVTSQNEPESLN
ncbi:MAG TPA: type II secretion system protein GspG [Blastocatellia bacterium]|nr:type II secretion system protein GspG [Blastocatellia bacterium]